MQRIARPTVFISARTKTPMRTSIQVSVWKSPSAKTFSRIFGGFWAQDLQLR